MNYQIVAYKPRIKNEFQVLCLFIIIVVYIEYFYNNSIYLLESLYPLGLHLEQTVGKF